MLPFEEDPKRSLSDGLKRTAETSADRPSPDFIPFANEDPGGTAATVEEPLRDPTKPAQKKKRMCPEVDGADGEGRQLSSRTIYLGNVTSEISANDILGQVRTGGVEALRFLTERGCAFLDFVSPAAASTFWHRLPLGKKLHVKGRDLRLAWAKPTIFPHAVETAVRNGATRCVYVGNLGIREETSSPHLLADLTASLRRECEPYGMIDTIRILAAKSCAFVYFACIADAMKAVDELSRIENRKDKEKGQVKRKIMFGKDRGLSSPSDPKRGIPVSDPVEEGQIRVLPTTPLSFPKPVPPRTVFLGGVSDATTAEDLCNVIRGGALEKIRLTPEKHCAFVTFIEPEAASSFYEFATHHGVWVRGGRLKAGWGQASMPSHALLAALRQGASRNVYIGNMDVHCVGEEELRRSFSRFGDIETVNLLRREKNVAFVSFCLLLDAVKAVEGIRKDPLFLQCTVSYGKDRCAQPLPPFQRPCGVPLADQLIPPPISGHFLMPVSYILQPSMVPFELAPQFPPLPYPLSNHPSLSQYSVPLPSQHHPPPPPPHSFLPHHPVMQALYCPSESLPLSPSPYPAPNYYYSQPMNEPTSSHPRHDQNLY